jgi:hypothetical protein
MKYLITTLITLAFSHQALACTQSDSAAESRLIRMFQVEGRSLDWVAAKTKKDPNTGVVSVIKNRSYDITVSASSRISASSIRYKNDTYNLDNAKICTQGNSIFIVHPKGELVVSRSGKSLGSAVIRLKAKGGLVNVSLRPQRLL